MAEGGFGPIVERPRRQLKARFHTSSMEKFLQARVVFEERGFVLDYFRESQEPYYEEYGLGSRGLLRRALDEIRKRLGANSLFFVEDTSVRVDALSDGRIAIPGLKVKEWFRDMSFEALDSELRRRNNDRGATVYSDIGLYVPGLERAVFVHGETAGRVADSAPQFEMSYEFPWLTPKTFNGWFIPEGSDKTLGEMEFRESLEYDFRAKSLTALLERIEEYSAIVNLPNNAYVARKVRAGEQEWLFPGFDGLAAPLVVIGRVCAGKTTLGERLAGEHGWRHIEASREMRRRAEEASVGNSGESFDVARELLKREGPDCVAKSIVARYHDVLERGTVITGFRAIEEVTYLRNRFPRCVVVFVDAGDRLRFSRHLRRGRLKEIRTRRDFEVHDAKQWEFGLLARARDVVDVGRDVADIAVKNEGGLEEYYAQIDGLLEGLRKRKGMDGAALPALEDVRGVSAVSVAPLSGRRIFRCLETLKECEGPARCDEIRARMKREEGCDVVSSRHLNWILRKLPQLARRMRSGGRWGYEILPAGRAYVEAVGLQSARSEAGVR